MGYVFDVLLIIYLLYYCVLIWVFLNKLNENKGIEFFKCKY